MCTGNQLQSLYNSGIYMIIIAVTDNTNDNSVAVLSIIPLSLGKFNTELLEYICSYMCFQNHE